MGTHLSWTRCLETLSFLAQPVCLEVVSPLNRNLRGQMMRASSPNPWSRKTRSALCAGGSKEDSVQSVPFNSSPALPHSESLLSSQGTVTSPRCQRDDWVGHGVVTPSALPFKVSCYFRNRDYVDLLPRVPEAEMSKIQTPRLVRISPCFRDDCLLSVSSHVRRRHEGLFGGTNPIHGGSILRT